MGIGSRDCESRWREIAGHALGQRSLHKQAHDDCAAAGAEIEDSAGPVLRQERKRRLDQRFGIGPRIEHRRSDLEVAAVEFAPPDDSRHRLMRAAAGDHRPVAQTGFAAYELMGLCDQLFMRDAGGMLKKPRLAFMIR